MRDVIARALLWVLRVLLPAHGRRRAPINTIVPASPPAPTPRERLFSGPSSEEVRAIFHAEEALSLPPIQRERWWAVAFAQLGIDYDIPHEGITPSRGVRV